MPGTRNMTRKKVAEVTEVVHHFNDDHDNVVKSLEYSSDEDSKEDKLPDLDHENHHYESNIKNELGSVIGSGSESESGPGHNVTATADDSESNDHHETDLAGVPQTALEFNLKYSTKNDGTVFKSNIRTKVPYQKMVTEAIETLNDKKGSSFAAIKKWILSNYPDCPRNPTIYINRAITKGIEAGIFYHPKENANILSRLKMAKKPMRSEKSTAKKDTKAKQGTSHGKGKKDDKENVDVKLFNDAANVLKATKPIEKKVENMVAVVPKRNTRVTAAAAVATIADGDGDKAKQPEMKKTVKAKETEPKKKKNDKKVPKKKKTTTTNSRKKPVAKENVEETTNEPSKVLKKSKATKKTVEQ